MVTFTFAKHYAHDISGIENPDEWVFENKNGVWYPVNLLTDCDISCSC